MTRTIRRRALLAGAAALPLAARAQAAPIKIGVLTDETGPYADSGGPGSIVAAQMAAADFGGQVLGRKGQWFRRREMFVDPRDGILKDMIALEAMLATGQIHGKGGAQ